MTSKVPHKGISRRTLLKSTGLITALAVAGVSTRSDAAEKLPKSQVGFQTSPNGSQQCGNCSHFLPSQHACNVVQGEIDANNWCQLWAAKS
jgi:hypothetical protein